MESLGMSPGALPSGDGLVFQLVYHFHRYWAYSSKSTVWPKMESCFQDGTCSICSSFTKAHLTLHFKMSGSRWVATPSWVSGSWRSFLYSSSVYSCHLLLISSASVKSKACLFFIVLIFAWNVPLASLIFLEEISSLSHSIVFLYFFALIRLSYLSLLFFGTLHSDGHIFPFVLCL